MIDCDDVPGGTKALARLRSTPANQQTVIIAIVNGSTSSDAALDSGTVLAELNRSSVRT